MNQDKLRTLIGEVVDHSVSRRCNVYAEVSVGPTGMITHAKISCSPIFLADDDEPDLQSMN